MNFRHGQLGLSLVELMVALAISSFLILGVTQIYIDNKSNYLFQQGQSANQENGRFTLMLLDRQLSKAGYRRRPDVTLEEAFPVQTLTASTGSETCAFSVAGQAVSRVDSSTICIRYQPRTASELDCAGTGVSSANAASINAPYTEPTEPFVEKITVSNGNLLCNGTTLVEGVAGVHFDFGIGAAGTKEVTSYTQTPGTSPIGSIRYYVLLTSQNNLRQGVNSQAYCDWIKLGDASADCTVPDDKLYQLVNNSMTLRNLMP
ncbi:PilW family protein [Pseudomonas sp.]|uniref:PilW family protein n=1 Tax=Pseudomonas sp. TaxID=306 RepID=UPI0028B1F751|nr:prepilin-type N-terminal cleavage/methylation domain-containing protein [Pseudomonas sp.]